MSSTSDSATTTSNEIQQKILMAIPHVSFKGVGRFLDIGPLLRNPTLLRETIRLMSAQSMHEGALMPTKIAGIDARGFIFGSLLASYMNLPFIMVRKKGKLPNELPLTSVAYTKEYSAAEGGNAETLCVQEGALSADDRVLVVDDVIATGGSMLAAAELIDLHIRRLKDPECAAINDDPRTFGQMNKNVACAAVAAIDSLKGVEKLQKRGFGVSVAASI